MGASNLNCNFTLDHYNPEKKTLIRMVAQFETSLGFATKKGPANFYFRGGVYYKAILSDFKKAQNTQSQQVQGNVNEGSVPVVERRPSVHGRNP